MKTGRAWIECPERRIRDAAVAATAMPVAVPLVAGGLALSALDVGSPIFEAERIGKNGRQFTMYKLRTMPEGTAITLGKGPIDSRASKIGNLLRLTAIDELPQLLHVIRGDMMLVGPRAPVPQVVEAAQSIMPRDRFEYWEEICGLGVGCLSSFINARRATKLTDEEGVRLQVEMDIVDYENASPMHDGRIIWQTAITAVRQVRQSVGLLRRPAESTI